MVYSETHMTPGLALDIKLKHLKKEIKSAITVVNVYSDRKDFVTLAHEAEVRDCQLLWQQLMALLALGKVQPAPAGYEKLTAEEKKRNLGLNVGLMRWEGGGE